MRIFTPMQELPLAGHPVVGTWNLLAQIGVTPQIENGSIKIEHELNLGVLSVEIEFREGKPFKMTMTQAKFESSEIISDKYEIEKLAEGLGLKVSRFKCEGKPADSDCFNRNKSNCCAARSLEAMSRMPNKFKPFIGEFIWHTAQSDVTFLRLKPKRKPQKFTLIFCAGR